MVKQNLKNIATEKSILLESHTHTHTHTTHMKNLSSLVMKQNEKS